MRFAYADPPYPRQARKHYLHEAAAAGRIAREVNHPMLIAHLVDEFPDGWALSTSSPALRELLPLCPADVRVGAWVKPFHVFKKGIRPAYAWEPVIFRGGRNEKHPPPEKGGAQTTPRDWVAANITLLRGTTGAKPDEFSAWIFDLLNVQPGDELVDLFPGSGAVADALDRWLERPTVHAGTIFETNP